MPATHTTIPTKWMVSRVSSSHHMVEIVRMRISYREGRGREERGGGEGERGEEREGRSRRGEKRSQIHRNCQMFSPPHTQ